MFRIPFLYLVLPYLTPSSANDILLSVTPLFINDLNWITIWLCFFFGVLFTMLFRYLNHKAIHVEHRRNAGLPVSGWVVFLGFNLVVRIFIQLYFFLNGIYFLKSAWARLGQLGGTSIHTLIIFEMFLSLFAIAGTGALLFWFMGKRDIFPRMCIYYALIYLAAILIQLFINYNVHLPEEIMGIRRLGVIHICRFLYLIIWIVYIIRSDQVKHTFVYPPN